MPAPGSPASWPDWRGRWRGTTLPSTIFCPAPFLTDRLRSLAATAAEKAGSTPDEELAKRAGENPAGRLGDPDEFGRACAFLCSAHSGFVVGQNFLLDGGAFNATLG